jgi:cellulose synthase (UDP-forming)
MLRFLLGLVACLFGLALIVVFAGTPLGAEQQILLSLVVLALALGLRRLPGKWGPTALVMLSVAASSRYLYWRLTTTLDLDSRLDQFFGWLLVGAEIYAYVVLFLGYFQTIHPLARRPVAMPADRSKWPTIDVFIPTYNEPLDVVRPTVLAALALDWPREKLSVWVLDDGRRPEMRELAARAGAGYIVRASNEHAKAGNLNHALKHTTGELVAIFDCDHIASRSFLQIAVGWFLKDPKLAVLQTPHHFYNPDPIDRNLKQFRRIPNEGELFYGYIQAGNDFWNASFFCGSCAILRRKALDEVGGIATESVTEDALTSLKIQRLGWNSAYLNVRQAAGLATDTLAAHIGQRVRWAQGMAQIFRVDNPLLGRGLSLGQRLCYLNAILHYFYGLPRVVFLTAPLAYLLFGAHICNTTAVMLLAYAVPHLAHAIIANSRTKGKHRYSFWDNVYETVLAIYILIPTTVAVLNPKAATFKVTAKGSLVDGAGLDRKIARPYLLLLALDLLGMLFGIARLLLWDYYDPGTVLINMAWTFGSVVVLGAALAIAWETKQMRRTHRVPARVRAMVESSAGHTVTGETRDLSLGGASLSLDGELPIETGDACTISLFEAGREHAMHARVAAIEPRLLRLQFDDLSLREEGQLVQVIFGRPDAWLDWEADRHPDKPLASFRNILRDSMAAIRRTAQVASPRAWLGGAVAVAIATAFLLGHTGWRFEPLVARVSAVTHQVADSLGHAAGATARN